MEVWLLRGDFRVLGLTNYDFYAKMESAEGDIARSSSLRSCQTVKWR